MGKRGGEAGPTEGKGLGCRTATRGKTPQRKNGKRGLTVKTGQLRKKGKRSRKSKEKNKRGVSPLRSPQ